MILKYRDMKSRKLNQYLKHLLWCLLIGFNLSAQINPSYTVISGNLKGNTVLTTGATLSFPNLGKTFTQSTLLREKNASAKLHMLLDLGNDYVKGSANWNFNVQVDFTYQFGTQTAVNRSLVINTKTPELLKIDDVLPILNANPTITPLLITITNVSITNGSNLPITGNALLLNYIQSNMRFIASLKREYDVDVRLQTSNIIAQGLTISNPVITNRLVTFAWQPIGVDDYPNYEIQILKLHNVDPALQTNLTQIASDVNWKNALKVETQSHARSISLTMAEGTGYYLWRVRPIGTYFKGGIANSENYGNWSYALPTNTATSMFSKNVLIQPNNPTPYAFHFTDPDENINWIYSRVFTEGDQFNKAQPTGIKSSEGMNYANGLLMSRQSQKYNSSENTNIVSQTMIDFSGRPALTTMPVPTIGQLSGYKLGLVRNTQGQLYTAEHFDQNSKLQNPDLIDTTGVNNPYQYYSNTPVTGGISNKDVASSEGYPFKRTLFKADGTNRVTEESGVGKRHALGLQSNGRGRTTRVMYGMPTDEELIRLFGDEAPLAESVIKTVTIDQNNVVSVTYTSKEGKTIATALVSDNANNLSPLKKAAITTTVTNIINENSSSGGKIVASKRVVFPTNTQVKLAYSSVTTSSVNGSSSTCPGGDCNFQMRLYLLDLQQGIKYVSDKNISTVGIDNFNPSQGGTFSFPSTWAFVSMDASNPATITPSGSSFDQLNLNAGEYLFIKEIFSKNSSNYVDSLMNVSNDITRPVIDALITQMQKVNGANSYTTFTQFLSNLTNSMTAYNNVGIFTAAASATLFSLLEMGPTAVPSPTYAFPKASEFTLSLTAPTATTTSEDLSYNNLNVSIGCCSNIKVPIPKPAVCYLCEGSSAAGYQNSTNTSIASMTAANSSPSVEVIPYGIEDFKNNVNWPTLTYAAKMQAINSLVEHEFIKPLEDKLNVYGYAGFADLWKFAPGFTPQSLNFMLSNMLISQYYTGRAVKHNNVWYAANYVSAANGYTLSAPISSLQTQGLPYNYDCRKLYDAWTSAMEVINSFETGSDANILNEFNDQGDFGSGQDNSEDDGNWLLDNVLVKKYLKKKISKELEEFSQGGGGTVSAARQEAITSFINMFMEEAGYQFAAIIDGDVLPGYVATNATVSPSNAYPLDFTNPTSISLGTLAGATNIFYPVTVNSSNVNVPVIFTAQGNTASPLIQNCANTGTFAEMYYPYILKPEWQFKYYAYNVFNNSFIGDFDKLLPNQVSVDIRRQYKDPFLYLTTPTITANQLCSKLVPISYTVTVGVSSPVTGTFTFVHDNWSSSDREQFYSQIKGASKCIESKGVDLGQPSNSVIPQCATKQELITYALADLKDRYDACIGKKSEIVEGLTNELIASCYTIVACGAGAGTGLVTEKEIELMADKVIAYMKDQVLYVKTTMTASTGTVSSVTTACSPHNSVTTGYGLALCNLPSCSQEDCYEIVLEKNNTLKIEQSRTLITKLYRDCDLKLLEMVSSGVFLPKITPFGNCPDNPAKDWENCSDGSPCDGPSGTHPYGEKQNCPSTKFEGFSNQVDVNATGP